MVISIKLYQHPYTIELDNPPPRVMMKFSIIDEASRHIKLAGLVGCLVFGRGGCAGGLWQCGLGVSPGGLAPPASVQGPFRAGPLVHVAHRVVAVQCGGWAGGSPPLPGSV